jgi:hypothetical protein
MVDLTLTSSEHEGFRGQTGQLNDPAEQDVEIWYVHE